MKEPIAAKHSALVCSSCGTTLEDFRRTGLVGCADCYVSLREAVLPAVMSAQGKSGHVGKKPVDGAEEKYDHLRALAYKKVELEERIAEAEQMEDEELLAYLKEQLEKLNRKLYGGDPS